MKRLYVRRALFILGVLAVTFLAVHSMPVPVLDLDALTSDSTLIVTGEVTSLRETGKSKIQFNDSELEVQVETGTIRVERILKGNPSPEGIMFQAFATDVPMGWATIRPYHYSVFFLKADSSGNVQFTSPYYRSLPAVPGFATAGNGTIDRVVGAISGVLSSPQSTSNQKTTTIFFLSRSKSAAATAALHEALNDSLREVQLAAAGALLERNDTIGLESVKEALLQRPQGISPVLSHNLSYAISEGLRDSKAIPTLNELLSSPEPEVRRAVASSVMHMKSPDAIDLLKSLLDDPDFEARYYAAVGLAEVTNQTDWHPGMEDFRANEEKYLSHWRAQTR